MIVVSVLNPPIDTIDMGSVRRVVDVGTVAFPSVNEVRSLEETVAVVSFSVNASENVERESAEAVFDVVSRETALLSVEASDLMVVLLLVLTATRVELF